MSIEGAKPRQGRLGAILYGPASRNEGRARSGSSLIDNIRYADPGWGVVEFHPATISFPERLPSHSESYATLKELINGGAHFLSPMHGSYVGDRVVHPDNFKAYDAMEGSAFEYQLAWWLRAMQARPAGSLYYPFGNELVKSSDGWTATAGTHLKSGYGELRLASQSSRLGMVSPQWEARRLTGATELVVTGKWQQSAVMLAELVMDNDEKLFCALKSLAPNQAHCQFPSAEGRQMLRLMLHWQFPAAQPVATAVVNSVALKFAFAPR